MKRILIIIARLLNILVSLPLIPYFIIYIIKPSIYGDYDYDLNIVDRFIHSLPWLIYSILAIIPYKLFSKKWLKLTIVLGIVGSSIVIFVRFINEGFSPIRDLRYILYPYGLLGILSISNIWSFFQITKKKT